MGYLSLRLRLWRREHPTWRTGRVALVMHTSCINYAMEDLKELNGEEFVWILPKDVSWELRLLTQSSIRSYREKALYLLSRASVCGETGEEQCMWELHDLYQGGMYPKDIWAGSIIFVAGDMTFQRELVECLSPAWDKQYILVQREWSCLNYRKDMPQVMSLEKARGTQMGRVHPLNPQVSTSDFFSRRHVQLKNGKHILISDLKDVGMDSGGYADIRSDGHQLYKCFKSHALDGERLKKLEILCESYESLNQIHMAAPHEIMYDEKGRAVGFSMPKMPGKSLYDIHMGRVEGYNEKEVLKSLALLLLELHNMHILVSDLSMRNILVGANNEVYLVDCDSVQIMGYPGGYVTPEFQHRDLGNQDPESCLRHPRYESFSFAVISFLYKFSAFEVPKVGSEDQEENWCTARFAMGMRENMGAPKRIYEQWLETPEAVRAAYLREFNFQGASSIGHWVDVLNLIN